MVGSDEISLVGKQIAEVIPALEGIFDRAKSARRGQIRDQIEIGSGPDYRTYQVQLTREGTITESKGFVVTLDDITDLLSAQRTGAWADVARRIAHEIKNPLTPIQLSAERIRRKYGDSITTDREIFDRCIDTISRHVGDIGRMVDEFSSFARMPKPVFEPADIGAIVKEAVILFQMSNSDIKYEIDVPKEPQTIECDRRLLTQAVTNLVKNAGEAIATARQSGQKGDDYRGRIVARVTTQGPRCAIEVIDNGCGLPAENRNRLMEPYVTTRAKGTGLGLAIVHRIAEQHDGVLQLDDAHGEDGAVTGATVRMVIPLSRSAEAGEIADVSDARETARAAEQPTYRHNGRKQGVSYGV
jgi:two-component system nitrogen regulation sensor histidine kinase NtrY